MRLTATLPLMLAALLGLGACSPTARLADHPLDGRRVAVTLDLPDAPFADFNMTIFDRVGSEAPVPMRDDRGGSLEGIVLESMKEQKEQRGERTPAHVLIDSVLVARPMAERIADLTEARGAQLMRFEAVDLSGEADYILDVQIEDYGIGSDSWDAPLFYEIMARLSLIEAESGAVLWKEQVLDVVPVARALLDVGVPPDHTASAAVLARSTFQQVADVLDGLAGYTARRLIAPLQEAYTLTVERERAYLEK